MNPEPEIILEYSKNILSGKEPHSFLKKLGPNFSERCIETPWVASLASRYHFKTLLDIGFTMSSLDYLGLLLELKKNYNVIIEAADIVKPERVKKRYPTEWLDEIFGVPVHIGDISDKLHLNKKFDAVTCISTIEHVGFDLATHNNPKTAFERNEKKEDVPVNRNPETSKLVLNNIAGVLKPTGKLIISIPVGKGGPIIIKDSLGYYCCYWEYDEKTWTEVVSHEKFRTLEQYLFEIYPDGFWRQVDGFSVLSKHDAKDKVQAEGLAIGLLEKK